MNAFLAELTVRSCLLAGGGWLCAEVLRRSSAAVRHALWAAVMCGLLALPFVMAATPEMSVGWLAAPPIAVMTPNPVAGAERMAADSTARSMLAAPIAVHHAISWSDAAGVLWLLVTLALFAGLAADCRRAATTAAVDVPQVRGIVRPKILLPAWFDAQSAERRRAILLHERAHIERHDCRWLLLARAACAMYWWNPLVWRGARALRLAAEEAADDRALAAMAATDYAGHLVDSARELRASFALAGAMSYTSHLEGRVKAILDPGRARRPLSRRATVGMAALATACLIPLAAATLVPAWIQTPTAGLPHFEAASVKPAGAEQGSHTSEHSDPVHLRITADLHYMLTRAYTITDQQVSGEPRWFRSELYTVDAVTAGPTPESQKMLMLRSLLADRFGLVLRQTSRDMPVYLLEIAPGGIKFKPLPPGEKPPKDPPRPDGMYARSFPNIPILVANLNGTFRTELHMNRTVLDRTGLTGNYHMYLSTPIINGEFGASWPSIGADLETQLGLRLVSTKAPMPAYVVVKALRPTAN